MQRTIQLTTCLVLLVSLMLACQGEQGSPDEQEPQANTGHRANSWCGLGAYTRTCSAEGTTFEISDVIQAIEPDSDEAGPVGNVDETSHDDQPTGPGSGEGQGGNVN